MSNTFISKYKPYFLDDFCLDHKLVSVLKTLLELDDLNILFIGNTNSGKTTLLYALIREYYGLTKTQPFPENNIMFINNLKEQGINYFRTEMKTFSQSHSNIYGKKKIVVVDDIDTVNEQSQQVFRNYIDKYKNNILFISVCTNIQKVIESIQSRIHIIRLHPPTPQQFHHIMDRIIQNENLVLLENEPTREFLITISENSIRTLINNLEKIYILGIPISLELCKKLCSNISFQLFENYILCLRDKTDPNRLSSAINILYGIHDYGYSVIDILDYFFTFIKTTDKLNEDEKYTIIPFLCKYITVFHIIHEDAIELALFTNKLAEMLWFIFSANTLAKMLKQLFRKNVPNELLFNLLEQICLKTDKYYVLDHNAYRKMMFHNLEGAFKTALYEYYYPSKHFYIERAMTHNSLINIVRQICKSNNIMYASQIKYNESKYNINYFIYM